MGGQFTQAITVRFPSLTGVVGDTITVPLYVDNDLTGSNVTAFQFDIGYNKNNVKLLEVNTVGAMASGYSNLIVKDYLDHFTIASAGAQPLVGKGILLNIKLVLIISGSPIQFRNTATNNYFNEGNPVLTFSDGYITINAEPVISVSPLNAVLNIGETQQFNVSGGTAPYVWSVSDNAMATITSAGILKVLKSGFVKVIAKDAKGYQGVSGNIDCRSFVATFRDTTFYQNNYIDIPFELKNLDATPMLSGKFAFSFTENVISLDSLIIANSILAGKMTIEHSKSSGKLIVSFAGSTGITSSGMLFKLRFKIADVPNGGSSIIIDESTINEAISPKGRNGYFSIMPLPSISLSPGSSEMFTGDKKQFTVTGGTSPYTWGVENIALGTVTSSGNFTANSGGVTKLLVRDVYGSKTYCTITIFDTWVNVRDTAAVISQNMLTLPIDLGNVPIGKGVISVSGKAFSSYSKIDSIRVASVGTLTKSWQLANLNGKNQTNFAMSGTNGITSAGKIIYFNIYFNKTIAIGDAFYVDCNDLLLNEGTPNVKVKSGYVTIKSFSTGLVFNELDNYISVYPIPASDKLFVNLPTNQKIDKLDLIDLTGRVIQVNVSDATNGKQIDIGKLLDGNYFIRIVSGQDIIFKKVIVSN